MADAANQIVEALTLRGIEDFRRYYGVYRASISDNKDPEQRGRVQVSVPIMGHNKPISLWVDPSFTGAGNDRGMFWPSEIGDPVRVTFDRGDSGKPIVYFSGWYGTEDLPEEFSYSSNGKPEKRGFITRMGHKLIFNDTPGEESLEVSCHIPSESDPANTDYSESSNRATGKYSKLIFDKNNVSIFNVNGSVISLDNENKAITIIDENSNVISMKEDGITILDKGGQSIFMDGKTINIQAANSVTINSNNVTVDSGSIFLGKTATFSSVLGEALLTWLNTHTHLTNTIGIVTLPPVIPALKATLLSNNVKLSK